MIKTIKPILAIQTEDAGFGGNLNNYSANLPADPLANKFNSLGEIISSLLPYILVVAGLLLLLMLISGGIGLMTSAGSPDKSKASYGRISGALIGFLIIFVSYFIAKIIELVLGVSFM